MIIYFHAAVLQLSRPANRMGSQANNLVLYAFFSLKNLTFLTAGLRSLLIDLEPGKLFVWYETYVISICSRQATRSMTPVKMVSKQRFPACPYQIGSLLNQLGKAYVTDGFTWWIFVSYSNKTCNIYAINWVRHAQLIEWFGHFVPSCNDGQIFSFCFTKWVPHIWSCDFPSDMLVSGWPTILINSAECIHVICIKIASTFLHISWIGKLF